MCKSLKFAGYSEYMIFLFEWMISFISRTHSDCPSPRSAWTQFSRRNQLWICVQFIGETGIWWMDWMWIQAIHFRHCCILFLDRRIWPSAVDSNIYGCSIQNEFAKHSHCSWMMVFLLLPNDACGFDQLCCMVQYVVISNLFGMLLIWLLFEEICLHMRQLKCSNLNLLPCRQCFFVTVMLMCHNYMNSSSLVYFNLCNILAQEESFILRVLVTVNAMFS